MSIQRQDRLPALLMALAGLALLVVGGQMSLAGIASYQAQAFVSDWEGAGSEPDPRAWDIAHAAAQRANTLYPAANGEYLDLLGSVHSWQHFTLPYADPVSTDSRLAARDAYRTAVAARPTWPYSWQRLAYSKAYLQEFDDEFDQAMAQAFRYGPWRVEVNRELARIGFSAWPRLDTAQQRATLESARRSVANGHGDAQRMLEYAATTGRLSDLCTSLSNELITTRKLTACISSNPGL